ncbi:GAF domain-containing protein [Microcoleus sp. AT3-A2]|uniref:GAF domain-containing protein n=1 Tax=Microcoleus sp. AT3-A2 TaxID=2818610 RepID=UPI002FD24729
MSLSDILKPLSRESFRFVTRDICCEGHQEREILNLILSFLDNMIDERGFDAVLYEKLQKITLQTGELLNADRATIFLFDEEPNELSAIVAKDENGKSLEIRVPAHLGIAGEVATEKKVVNIPYDFYDDPRSVNAKKVDDITGYRTSTMLAMPLLNEETGKLIAVVQLINKLKPNHQDYGTLDEQIDKVGFTEADEQIFREFAPSIRLILESVQSLYALNQRQLAATALMHAVSALCRSSLDLDDTLKRVMDGAQELMQADRSILWLIDEDKDELWTKIPIGGNLKEIRIPRTAGFAGIVAQSGEPLLIPFDIYDDSRPGIYTETDKKTGYRTCSMLCMPVFNADHKLIGVTQLVNKTKKGDFPPYNPENWPQAPEQWKASFSQTDMEFMKAFNIQAGVALQNAILFSKVKQQENRHKDIVRSLPNGVISTDKKGKVITANDRAKQLLGASEGEVVEGVFLGDLIKIENENFSQWLNAALSPEGDRDREQYYPNLVLLPLQGEPQNINLWINSIASAIDPNKINGVLVMLENNSRQNQGENWGSVRGANF